MDGQLVQLCCPSDERPSDPATKLIALVEELLREVGELRFEVYRLQRENLELRQQVGYWKSRHRDALGRVTALEQKVEQLEGEKRQLQADLFGRRSEAQAGKDRSNDLDDPEDDSQGPAMFSIFATLSLWKLNPRKWLTWYFEHCAAAGGKVPADIQPFLPWNLDAAKRSELGEPGLPERDDTS